MHPSFGDALACPHLRQRDPVFFVEAYEAMFLVVMASLKEMLFRLGSLYFKERGER